MHLKNKNLERLVHEIAEPNKNGSGNDGSGNNGSGKTADYIYAHLQDLTRMARQEDLVMLVYLLEMAQIEAMEISKQIRK